MLIDYIRKLEKYKILKRLIDFGKKNIYNPYLKSKLVLSDFPPDVWIENTNICNASCIMCPRDKLTRKLGFMDIALYEKLIKEIARFNNKVNRVHLHNYGEPLLDRELLRRIKLAKDYGIKHAYFVTNGSLLTPEMSKQIIEAGLDEFKVSFYGTDQDTYDRTMKGLSFEKTLQNLKDFFKMRDELGKDKPKTIIQYIPSESNESKIEDFYSLMRPLIRESTGDSLLLFSLHNFGGGMSYNIGKIVYTCNFPWRTMVILHDGRVVMCSLDYNGVQVVGDVNKSTIHEIWNDRRYQCARENFRNLRYDEYPVCIKCNIPRR